MLFAELELLENRGVARVGRALQVVEKTTALGDEFEKATPRGVVFAVGLEVLGESENALSKECDLHIRATCIFGVKPEGVHF